MTNHSDSVASRVAPAVRAAVRDLWEVYGERIERHELHWTGQKVDLVRGPVELEGFGVRVVQPRGDTLRVGSASSNSVDESSIARVVRQAGDTAEFGVFPAKSFSLPAPAPAPTGVSAVDRALLDDAPGALKEFTGSLLGQFDGRPNLLPSFGSARATVRHASVANSAGVSAEFVTSFVEFELAVKSVGGAEGRPPGEFWVNRSARRLSSEDLGIDVERWGRLARDTREGEPPPTGELSVVFSPEILSDVLGPIIGVRMSGAGRLRKIAQEVGTKAAASGVQLRDDGLLPWGTGTQPFDDEGTPHASHTLIRDGQVEALLYDQLHASSFGTASTGSGHRVGGLAPWYGFPSGVVPSATNLVLGPENGQVATDLADVVGDGIWLEQLGFPFPDPFAGTYGGEIRAGYRIRNGKLAEPLRGGTVGGSLIGPPGAPSLLSGIRAFGARAELVGSLLTPWVVVDKVGVAGAL